MTDSKKSAASKPEFRRNDRDGHLDPAHAASLRDRARATNTRDDDRAFVTGHRTKDALAEELAEDAVAAMTSGEDQLTNDLAADVPEELGGPFITTTEAEEMADGTDDSNPREATREPFPKT